MITENDVTRLIPNLSNVSSLSRGGQKVVFKADHTQNGGVVVKFMLVDNATKVKRAEREILAIQQVRDECPDIPEIFEHQQCSLHGDDYLAIIEQRIEGDTVEHLINTNQVLSLKDAFTLLETLLTCCAVLEDKHLVHRDIKPANIIKDSLGKFWLIDFGIARHLDLESVTDTGNQYGPHTPGYAPPEQFRNSKKEIDSRSDIFSIGITVRTAATGQNPFTDGAGDRLEILRRTETLSLPVVNIPGDTQKQFASLLNVMADHRISRRPQSCKEALGWLNQVKRSLNI